MLHVNYNQCRLLLILFGDIPHTIIKFPENALFGLGTHNLSFLVHVIVLLHLVCTSILVSNDATRNFVCILICSQQFSSYLQLVHSAFAVCNIISCLQEQGFSISSGVVSAVYWKKIADSAISVLTACGFFTLLYSLQYV